MAVLLIVRGDIVELDHRPIKRRCAPMLGIGLKALAIGNGCPNVPK